jgi:Tol biopolymer transport system component
VTGAAPLPAPPGRTLLVSRKKVGPFANAGSIEPSASADGRFVAFTSIASDLTPGDAPNTVDVFVIDRQTNQVTRAPRPPSPAGVGGKLGSSSDPSISADGNIVAFTWQAPTPAATPAPTPTPTEPPDIIFATIPATFVYAWNRRNNTIEPISRSSRGTRVPGARQPSISANGRFVAYTTVLDLPNDKDDNADDVVRLDRRTGALVHVSVAFNGEPFISGGANAPSISGDGSLVAFVSDGGDSVVDEDTGNGQQVYVRNVAAGTTQEVSKAQGGGKPDGSANEPAISQDGRFVAYAASSTNLVGGAAAGRGGVFRRDLARGQNVLVSVRTDGTPTEAASGQPAITPDGAMVAFTSAATDLVPETAGRVAPAAVVRGASDVFIRDLGAGETVLASVSLANGGSGGRSFQPAVAGSGRYILFASDADNLVVKDGNKALDVFVRDLPPMPVLNPPRLDLGSRAVGTESLPGAAVLSNIGWSPLGVANASIGGRNGPDFRIVANGCRARVLKRNEACTVSVVFKPRGQGTRTGTLTIADSLVTSTLTVSLTGTASKAKIVIEPTIGRPGIVVMVVGSGFPPGSQVRLRWSRGITQRRDPVIARGGSFRVPMLIFHNDRIGLRDLIAEPVDGRSFPPVSAPVLVTESTSVPPQFSVTPRFIDLPLVLVMRG